MFYCIDMVFIYDFDIDMEIYQVVKDEFNLEDVKCFCIKEYWFFDIWIFILQVCILGIVFFIEEYDDNGNFWYECFLFWIYYLDVCELFVYVEVLIDGFVYSFMSWVDIFDMCKFFSYIMKAFNLYDECLEGIYIGVDFLQ